MPRMLNSRSLHFAPTDFLWSLMALVYLMRPSLRKGAYVALSSAVWQEIRVRYGPTAGRDRRDDTSVRNGQKNEFRYGRDDYWEVQMPREVGGSR
jgi:hypothetical protein